MAEYLQGDVSGHWEIVSFTNSSHLVFATRSGCPTSKDYSGRPLLSSLQIPPAPMVTAAVALGQNKRFCELKT